MSRYYSPQYARVDDPYHRDAFSSDVTLESSSYPDEVPPNQRSLPSSYLDQKYPQRRPKGWWATWSRRRKIFVVGSVAAFIVLIIIIAAAVAVTRDSFSYTPSYAQVTNAAAFTSGGATHDSPEDVTDGVAGEDVYKYYTGTAANFPPSTSWVSFDNMWNANLQTLQTSCSNLGYGPDNTPEIIQEIGNAIQNRSAVSLVDQRFIFAVILQESKGCVHVSATKSSSGISNPGLMQSHNGHSYDSAHSNTSILAMVQDGTQGTKDGAGLVQNLNTYGNPYKAARGYNSGVIPPDGNLSEAAGATACYVSDIANRLTGWVNAKSTCPGDDE